MIDVSAFLGSIAASGAIAGIMLFLFKRYMEKRIEYTFEKKLKEYESKLELLTALSTKFSQERIDEYKKLSNMVIASRKHAVKLCEKSNPTDEEISMVDSEVRKLENLLYEYSGTLINDRIYERVHSYKIELINLIKNIKNEKKLLDKGQIERAKGVREIINRSINDIKREYKLIANQLAHLILPRIDT